MQIEYREDTATQLKTILGSLDEFEDQISLACEGSRATQIAVHPLTPGRSGAAVFLVRRIGSDRRLASWVVKASDDPKLIIEERRNNNERIRGRFPSAPTLIPTGSSRVLIFEFGGALAEFKPITLRSGYSKSTPKSLATLMDRIVTLLQPLHRLHDDVVSCADRMPNVTELETHLRSLKPPLPEKVCDELCGGWGRALAQKDLFPLRCAEGHGDLNSGNVLFQAGSQASLPVFIDFASMRKTKDSIDYPDYRHLPFWDYVKIDRDIQTRLFLREAIDAALETDDIIAVVRWLDGATDEPPSPLAPVIEKVSKTTAALRAAITRAHAPVDLTGYRLVLARALLTVLFRKEPDGDVPLQLQYRVAAEGAIALLSQPTSPLPTMAGGRTRETTPQPSNPGSTTNLNLSIATAEAAGEFYVVVENTGSSKAILRAQASVKDSSGFSQALAGMKYPIAWRGVKGRDATLYPREEAALRVSSLRKRNDGLSVFDLYCCTQSGTWANPIGSVAFSDTLPWAVVQLDLLTEAEQYSVDLRIDPKGVFAAS